MQYLLSQEEYEALAPKVELTKASHSLAAAREVILDLADFDCIHKPGGKNEDGYCSDCPAAPWHQVATAKPGIESAGFLSATPNE